MYDQFQLKLMIETQKIICSSPPGCRPQLGGLISPQGRKSGFDCISFEHKHYKVLMLWWSLKEDISMLKQLFVTGWYLSQVVLVESLYTNL